MDNRHHGIAIFLYLSYWLIIGGILSWFIPLEIFSFQDNIRWSEFAFLTCSIVIYLLRPVRLGWANGAVLFSFEDSLIYAAIIMLEPATVWHAIVAGRLLFEVYRLLRGLMVAPEKVKAIAVFYYFSSVFNYALLGAISIAAMDWCKSILPSNLSFITLFFLCLMVAFVWFFGGFLLNWFVTSIRLWSWKKSFSSMVVQVYSMVFGNAVLMIPLGMLIAKLIAIDASAMLLMFIMIELLLRSGKAKQDKVMASQVAVQAVVDYLEERDPYTGGHSRRVADYACKIGEQMGLDDQELQTLYRAGLIHDLGKIDVTDAVLRKPGNLTEEEYKEMQKHTERVVELGQSLVSLRDDLPFHLAAYHHEHFDGGGYYGLSGPEIPLTSRILAVADTYDALTSDRPYRKGFSRVKARNIIQDVSGSQLDPEVVLAFLEIEPSF